ncbi:hypothetical protein Purlil1_13636 [Purpureocillium lilacinum]|uniref:Uncharacterized protein n=1 Tax=Purpureocillium lilacinum TaxID=33203 RepID=A0ABR0BDQ0_PURLI|nr:hypothetical protein Purlil1_13636 [Purpureocillium lilacinum]
MYSTTNSTEAKEPQPWDPAALVSICLGGILALVIIVVVLYTILRKRRKIQQRDIQRDIERSNDVRNVVMNLQTLDSTIPEQTYMQSKKELEQHPSWALHRSTTSEVCKVRSALTLWGPKTTSDG